MFLEVLIKRKGKKQFLAKLGSTSTSIDNFGHRSDQQRDQTLLEWVILNSVENVLFITNGQTFEQKKEFNLIFESALFSM